MSAAFWLEGKEGALSRKAQAQVWALTEMSAKLSVKLTQTRIASMVEKIGGGHPSQKAISKLQATDATFVYVEMSKVLPEIPGLPTAPPYNTR